MCGNQHLQEQHNKNQARKSLRAFLIGYTLLDMVFLMMFTSMFALSLRVFTFADRVPLEEVLLYKKKLDHFEFSCLNDTLYIGEVYEAHASCTEFETYIEIEAYGYTFYAIKRE